MYTRAFAKRFTDFLPLAGYPEDVPVAGPGERLARLCCVPARVSCRTKMATACTALCTTTSDRAAFLNTIVFGQASTAGLTSMVYDTVGAAVPATPFQITVTPPSSGTFAADLGVISASTGRALTRVASAPPVMLSPPTEQ